MTNERVLARWYSSGGDYLVPALLDTGRPSEAGREWVRLLVKQKPWHCGGAKALGGKCDTCDIQSVLADRIIRGPIAIAAHTRMLLVGPDASWRVQDVLSNTNLQALGYRIGTETGE